jgi:hypothetical protein
VLRNGPRARGGGTRGRLALLLARLSTPVVALLPRVVVVAAAVLSIHDFNFLLLLYWALLRNKETKRRRTSAPTAAAAPSCSCLAANARARARKGFARPGASGINKKSDPRQPKPGAARRQE